MNQSESECLLRDCRELLTARMRSSMTRVLGDVEDLLFDMAGTAGTPAGEGPDYIDAVREIRMKKREMQVRFENRLMEQFDRVVRSAQAATSPADVDAVIDIRQTRPDLAERQVEKLRGECRLALAELDSHIGKLLHMTINSSFDNPLAPRMVLNAFHDCCRDVYVGNDIHHILLDRFDRHVGPVLQGVYEDLNGLFQSYETGAVDNEAAGRLAGSAKEPLPLRLAGNWIREKLLLIDVKNVPGFVRAFALETWTIVLQREYEKHGEGSAEWRRALQVVTDLYDCTRGPVDKDARQRHLWTLPGLVYRLKGGMKMAAIPLKAQADFFRQLKAHHADLAGPGRASGNGV